MSHAKLIERLGGPRQIAETLHAMTGEDFNYEMVRKWKTQSIPWKWRPAVTVLAQQHGIAIPKDFMPKLQTAK